jgi:hypothetical protein
MVEMSNDLVDLAFDIVTQGGGNFDMVTGDVEVHGVSFKALS